MYLLLFNCSQRLCAHIIINSYFHFASLPFGNDQHPISCHTQMSNEHVTEIIFFHIHEYDIRSCARFHNEYTLRLGWHVSNDCPGFFSFFLSFLESHRMTLDYMTYCGTVPQTFRQRRWMKKSQFSLSNSQHRIELCNCTLTNSESCGNSQKLRY